MINYFSGAPPGEREKWFQYIIGQIYKQYVGQNIGLKEMNKRAIDVMLQTLTPSVPQSQPQLQPPLQQALMQPPHHQLQQPPQHQQFNQLKSHSQQSLNDQFSRRQAEYDLMVKKETPTPHFTENVKDEAIVDLTSAVEAYKRNRNEDADVVIPKPKDAVGLEKLDLSNAQPISLVVEEIPQSEHGSTFDISSRSQHQHGIIRRKHPSDAEQQQVPLKGVQWGNNTEHVFDNNNSIVQNNIESRLNTIEKDIRDMKSTLLEILAKLNV
jgi:hypothetical protein